MANPFFRSNLRGVITFHMAVARASLRAAAVVVQNEAKRNVRGGFKSGNFVTGNLQNKITHEVKGGRAGLVPEPPSARVGTAVDYGAYWELGAHNIFTGQYEREEWLKPAFEKTMGEQQAAAANAAAKVSRSSIVRRFGGR